MNPISGNDQAIMRQRYVNAAMQMVHCQIHPIAQFIHIATLTKYKLCIIICD